MKARVFARHLKSGMVKTFIVSGSSAESIEEYFKYKFPAMVMYRIDPLPKNFEEISEPEPKPKSICVCSSIKRRSHYKARLCQVRGNLQSMTDSEEGLLTTEEILALSRISCKLDRVIALFNTRTMDLKNEGKL